MEPELIEALNALRAKLGTMQSQIDAHGDVLRALVGAINDLPLEFALRESVQAKLGEIEALLEIPLPRNIPESLRAEVEAPWADALRRGAAYRWALSVALPPEVFIKILPVDPGRP
ncbi:hypothetical protein [Variovorax saccharolyticus]|uniref:hypothetical protein n=1 Tax=Variovorax saccharolyticus TaxID=3053516 RepID=UPI0025756CD9|nr:hypothetical protein [Variovorax sp. J31P216]MDM0029153.1 hypothetical protein [Variovorax sp. J31P216]